MQAIYYAYFLVPFFQIMGSLYPLSETCFGQSHKFFSSAGRRVHRGEIDPDFPAPPFKGHGPGGSPPPRQRHWHKCQGGPFEHHPAFKHMDKPHHGPGRMHGPHHRVHGMPDLGHGPSDSHWHGHGHEHPRPYGDKGFPPHRPGPRRHWRGERANEHSGKPLLASMPET